MIAPMQLPAAVKALSDPEDFAREFGVAGYRNPHIEHVTRDFELVVTSSSDPHTLFGISPNWTSLDGAQKAAVVAEVRTMAGDRSKLSISSTALLAVAVR